MDTFVLDEADVAGEREAIEALGLEVLTDRTLLHLEGAASQLVATIVDLSRRAPSASGVGA